MLGMPGNLLVRGPLAVAKMIKNARKSIMPQYGGVRDMKCIRTPKVKLCWKSGGEGVPKMTEMAEKPSSPGRNFGGTQTLYTFKSISGNGVTSGLDETTRERTNG